MNNDIDTDLYNSILNLMLSRDKPIEYTDTKKMSSKQKSAEIRKLDERIHELERQMEIREVISQRLYNGMLKNKQQLEQNLMRNPYIPLSNGYYMRFSDLTAEQKEYLESIGKKQNSKKK